MSLVTREHIRARCAWQAAEEHLRAALVRAAAAEARAAEAEAHAGAAEANARACAAQAAAATAQAAAAAAVQREPHRVTAPCSALAHDPGSPSWPVSPEQAPAVWQQCRPSGTAAACVQTDLPQRPDLEGAGRAWDCHATAPHTAEAGVQAGLPPTADGDAHGSALPGAAGVRREAACCPEALDPAAVPSPAPIDAPRARRAQRGSTAEAAVQVDGGPAACVARQRRAAEASVQTERAAQTGAAAQSTAEAGVQAEPPGPPVPQAMAWQGGLVGAAPADAACEHARPSSAWPGAPGQQPEPGLAAGPEAQPAAAAVGTGDCLHATAVAAESVAGGHESARGGTVAGGAGRPAHSGRLAAGEAAAPGRLSSRRRAQTACAPEDSRQAGLDTRRPERHAARGAPVDAHASVRVSQARSGVAAWTRRVYTQQPSP